MKKELAMAFGIVAVSAMVLVVAIALQAGGDEGPRQAPRRDLLPPARVPVLAGAGKGLEVLVRCRLPSPEARRNADRMLARALGLEPRATAFLEVLVLNAGEQPRSLALAALVLETGGAEAVPVTSLRDAVRDDPAHRALLAVHAPDPGTPLQPGRLRRGLVAVPRDLSLGVLVGGRLAGVELRPRQVGTAELEAWLERPRRPLLMAVSPGDEEQPGKTRPGEGGR